VREERWRGGKEKKTKKGNEKMNEKRKQIYYISSNKNRTGLTVFFKARRPYAF